MNYYFPGLYSVLVPWFDIPDFYYSGHISTAVIFCYAAYNIWRRLPESKFAKFAFFFLLLFRIPYTWTVMTVTRTHFIIDFNSALVISCCYIMVAEKICYYPEVKLLGLPARKRILLMHYPCPYCGWSNASATLLIDHEEKRA